MLDVLLPELWKLKLSMVVSIGFWRVFELSCVRNFKRRIYILMRGFPAPVLPGRLDGCGISSQHHHGDDNYQQQDLGRQQQSPGSLAWLWSPMHSTTAFATSQSLSTESTVW